MDQWRSILYALVISIVAHLLMLASIEGWSGGRPGTLRFPGLLLVELINLGSTGAHAQELSDNPILKRNDLETGESMRIEDYPRPSLHRRMTLTRQPARDESPKDDPKPDPSSADDAGAKPVAPDPAEEADTTEDPAALDGEVSPSLPSPPGQPGPGPEAPPTPVTEDARCANCPPPEYPRQAQLRGLEGEVDLVIEVRADGSVGEVRIAASPGYPILEEAAVAAALKWTFYPATQNGEPVSSTRQVRIPFVLKRP